MFGRQRRRLPSIAVIHHRFYDLPDFMATPISDVGEMPPDVQSHQQCRHEKAWLTLSGYQSLI
jgi:hypothetical protein